VSGAAARQEGRESEPAVRPDGVTPSQTVGPFFAIGLPWPDGPFVVDEGAPGAIVIAGRVLDGAGDPVPDALVETWQAGPDGRFSHPDDPRGDAGDDPRGVAGTVPGSTGGGGSPAARFRGFGRCPTDAGGRFRVVTLRPGPLPWPGGGTEAPHLDVSVFARGLLDRVVTRIYFADERDANAADPVLNSIADPARRETLIAIPEPGAGHGDERPAAYRFDVRLQGARETVFFDL